MKTIAVTRAVRVSLDESFFTPEWIAEFESYMYPLDGIDEVYADLAEKFVAGIIDGHETLIEGYGDPKAFKLRFEQDDETRSYSETHEVF